MINRSNRGSFFFLVLSSVVRVYEARGEKREREKSKRKTLAGIGKVLTHVLLLFFFMREVRRRCMID